MSTLTVDTIINLPEDTFTGLNLVRFDPTRLASCGPIVSPDERKKETIYQYLGDDDEHPLTVRVGHYRNPAANDGVGQTNISVKLSTTAYNAASATYRPFTMTIASCAPGNSGVPDPVQYMQYAEAALAMLIASVVAGEATTGVIDKLSFSVTEIVA